MRQLLSCHEVCTVRYRGSSVEVVASDVTSGSECARAQLPVAAVWQTASLPAAPHIPSLLWQLESLCMLNGTTMNHAELRRCYLGFQY